MLLRITGGTHCGRGIKFPERSGLRPTRSRLREALFSSLLEQIEGAKILDLFSGSGIMGFEALSRGAQSVIYVEMDGVSAQSIKKNALSLGFDKHIKVLKLDISREIKKIKGLYNIIFADPPFAKGWEIELLENPSLHNHLIIKGYFCIEWAKTQDLILPERICGLVKVREKNYGESTLTHYQRFE